MVKKISSQPLVEFNPKLPKLSKNETRVLKLLIEAGRLIAPVYLEQKKAPKIDRKAIEKTAKTDPAVLSPFTVVEKVDGKLVATPYHLKYAKLLKPVAEKLEEASRITENKKFGVALKTQAKALLNGTYEEALAAWLKVEPYTLDISIGPLHHFDDHLFSGKASYQAWVGVLDTEGTERLNNYKSIIFGSIRKALLPKERIDTPDHIKSKTIDEVLLSGLIAETKYVGINLPMHADMAQKYGTEATVFNCCNDLRIKEQIIPTFNKIFSPAFKKGFSAEDLRRGYLRNVALHELAHSFLFYKNSLKNLEDLFPIIYELSATLLGHRLAGALLLKDRITDKQLESMILTYTCRSFYLLLRRRVDKVMSNYALSGTVFINFMIENGAMKSTDSIVVINFMKMFVAIHELSVILERLLSQGTRKDAEKFIKRYGEIKSSNITF
jgi:hypothetical protein